MSRLPEVLNPWRAAEQGRQLEGVIALSLLPRLTELLVTTAGEACFELEFFRDAKRRHCVKGKVAARLWQVSEAATGVTFAPARESIA